MLVSFALGQFYASVYSLLKLICCLLHHLPGKLGSVSINVTVLISRRRWQRQRRLVDVWSTWTMGKFMVGRARMCLGVFVEHRQKWGNWVMERSCWEKYWQWLRLQVLEGVMNKVQWCPEWGSLDGRRWLCCFSGESVVQLLLQSHKHLTKEIIMG